MNFNLTSNQSTGINVTFEIKKMRSTTIFFLLITYFSFSQQTYVDSLTNIRTQHEIELLQSKNTPLNEVEIQQIQQLSYFSIDVNNIVAAKFKKKIGKPFDLPTSSGKTKLYRKFGEVTCIWNGNFLKLNVYQDLTLIQHPTYANYLIIPFKDGTSGNETYGGGRYLDMRIPASKKIKIDFNTAYNPYCAFSYRFNCPIPPIENHLNFPIEAGEKTPLFNH